MLDSSTLAWLTGILTFLLTLLKLWKALVIPKVIKPIEAHFELVHESARAVKEMRKELAHNGGSSVKDIVRQLLEDQKDFGQSLSRLEGLVQAILSVSKEGIWIADERGGVLWVNGWFAEHIGWMPHEMHGFGWKNAVHPDCRHEVFSEFEECIREQRDFIKDFAYTTKGGERIEVSARCSPMRKKSGGYVIGHVGFVQHST